jgi:adenylosuccinate synthase
MMLNKLDILSGLDEVRVCTGYLVDGRPARWPLTLDELEAAEPVYTTLPGWPADLGAMRTMEELPAEASAYVDLLEDLAGVPITLVSVGPERTQTIVRTGRISPRPLRAVAAG